MLHRSRHHMRPPDEPVRAVDVLFCVAMVVVYLLATYALVASEGRP